MFWDQEQWEREGEDCEKVDKLESVSSGSWLTRSWFEIWRQFLLSHLTFRASRFGICLSFSGTWFWKLSFLRTWEPDGI